MIPLSSKEIIRHEVDDVTYLIAVPTVMTRAAFRRSLSSLGAVYHTDGAMLDCLRDGINAIVTEDQRGKLIEAIDSFEFEQKRKADGEEIDEEDFKELTAQIVHVEDFMRREFPRYAQMEGDRRFYLEMYPVCAFRQFVVGWESDACGYNRRGDLVPESMLEQVPEKHIGDVGWKCSSLMHPEKEQEKNSESQSSSASDQETSTAADIPLTADPAGKSEAKSTRRIRH